MKTLYYKDNKVGHKILVVIAAVALVVTIVAAAIYTIGKRYEAICKDSAVFLLNDRLYRCEPVRIEESQRA